MNTRQINNATEQTMVERAFLDPGPSMIIADEGHIIKNPRVNEYSKYIDNYTKMLFMSLDHDIRCISNHYN
jgi:CTP-dependent riboflavin kinase